MSTIISFSPEVCQKIGYYVYRLIDPTNGQTFYVGKGKNNRVFAHALGALKNYEGADYIEEDEDATSLKIKTIRSIKDAGLDVIHIIQRWGLTKEEAFMLESALIDVYPGLSNLQGGHDQDFGVINAEQLERILSVKPYEEPDGIDYMIIKIRQSRIEYMAETYEKPEEALYHATRSSWNVSPSSAKKHPYILSVVDGIVREVYIADEWIKTGHQKRYEFVGKPADEKIRSLFLGLRIPAKYVKKGSQSPFLYSKKQSF